jgi:hypothetical protein
MRFRVRRSFKINHGVRLSGDSLGTPLPNGKPEANATPSGNDTRMSTGQSRIVYSAVRRMRLFGSVAGLVVVIVVLLLLGWLAH